MTPRREFLAVAPLELRLHLTANVDAEGQPRELFVRTTDRSERVPALEAVAIVISVALQYGVPLVALTAKLRGMAGRPSGTARVPWRTEGRAPISSLASLLATWLEWRFSMVIPDGDSNDNNQHARRIR